MKYLVFILFVLIMAGCSEDESEFIVEEEFQVYLDRFISEAEQRGIEIDISELTIIREKLEDGICGRGQSDYNMTGTQRVSIHTGSQCWEDLADYEKEFLMFHEFGHALLGRIHREGKFPFGAPASIMCAQSCSGNLRNFERLDDRLKHYLVDQLFDEFIDPPSWLYKKAPSLFYQENLGIDTSRWQILNSNCDLYTFNSINDNNGNSSLTISAPTMTECNAASWNINFEMPELKHLSFIKATVILDLESMEGYGPSISLLTLTLDGFSTKDLRFTSTLSDSSLSGDQKNKELIITFPGYILNTNALNLSLSLNSKSKGTVQFKEVKIEVFEP